MEQRHPPDMPWPGPPSTTSFLHAALGWDCRPLIRLKRHQKETSSALYFQFHFLLAKGNILSVRPRAQGMCASSCDPHRQGWSLALSPRFGKAPQVGDCNDMNLQITVRLRNEKYPCQAKQVSETSKHYYLNVGLWSWMSWCYWSFPMNRTGGWNLQKERALLLQGQQSLRRKEKK